MRFVTSNRHKFAEVSETMKQYSIEVSWEELTYEESQADTTEEISLDSCRKLQKNILGDFFIEDTGLYVDSLNGFPGPYSSYVQKTIGNEGLLKLLAGKNRNAKFVTVITLSFSGKIKQFKGVLEGIIALSITGDKGFGYDPVFIPSGQGKTLAQMETDEKNIISHRGKAVGQMIDFLRRT